MSHLDDPVVPLCSNSQPELEFGLELVRNFENMRIAKAQIHPTASSRESSTAKVCQFPIRGQGTSLCPFSYQLKL